VDDLGPGEEGGVEAQLFDGLEGLGPRGRSGDGEVIEAIAAVLGGMVSKVVVEGLEGGDVLEFQGLEGF